MRRKHNPLEVVILASRAEFADQAREVVRRYVVKTTGKTAPATALNAAAEIGGAIWDEHVTAAGRQAEGTATAAPQATARTGRPRRRLKKA